MRHVERESPDIYLIDHRLPGTKDGIDLAAEILDEYPSAPILFVTANEQLKLQLTIHRIFDGKKIKV
jgi:DNA-binding LytR/AlgR family response regulator